MRLKLMTLTLASLAFTLVPKSNQVLEVTSFNLKATADPASFNEMDAQVEAIFTGKQLGFIKRQSAVNDEGEYVVWPIGNHEQERKEALGDFMGTIIAGIYKNMELGAYNMASDFEKAAGRSHKTPLAMIQSIKNRTALS